MDATENKDETDIATSFEECKVWQSEVDLSSQRITKTTNEISATIGDILTQIQHRRCELTESIGSMKNFIKSHNNHHHQLFAHFVDIPHSF